MAKKLQSEQLDEQPETRVSTVTPPQTLVARRDDPPESWPTSLQVGSPRWKALLLNAQTTPDVTVTNGEEVVFTAVDWLVQWTERIDRQTGEVSQFSQVVLFSRDGDTLATSSEVVAHQLARCLRVFSPTEWAAGLTFRFRGRTSAAGRTYHQMRVVPQEGV